MSVIVAVPTERRPEERRVALDPTTAERLQKQGFTVRIEAECGAGAGFMTEDYASVAVFPTFAETVTGADVVIKVSPPTLAEIAQLPEGVVLITLMSAFQHKEEVLALLSRGVTTLAMDLIPRITRAQSMDALSSQSTVAGYKAALLAAQLSPRLFPMLTTAAGSIRPSRVIVIGAGVAGLQAIATARRLGAQVEAYDIRSAAREQIESLGARMIDTGVEAEGVSGYARGLKKSEKQQQHDVLAEHLSRAHVVICAAAIPGRRAPRIVTADMVDGMMTDTVIVDMAADTGGNCLLTRPGEQYLYHRTLIAGPINLPSQGAFHASEMYARNVSSTLALCVDDAGAVFLDPEDEIITGCILTHAGQICHEPTARLLSLPVLLFGDVDGESARAASPDDVAGWLSDAELAPLDERGEGSAESVGAASSDSQAANLNVSAHELASAGSLVEAGEAAIVLQRDGHEAVHANPIPSAESKPVKHTDPHGQRSSVETAEQVSLSDDSSIEAQAALEEAAWAEGVSDLEQLDGVAGSRGTASPDEPEAIEPADDLTLIDGIGPAMQKRLNAFGVTQLRQLAELDEPAVRLLSDQLELDDDRILDDDWSGQARRVLQEAKG